MRHTFTRYQTLVVFLGILTFLALNVHIGYAAPRAAPRTAAYDIAWYAVANGGGQELTGSGYSLEGTAGQFDAGAESGGGFTDYGGFWLQVDVLGYQYQINLPLVIR